MKKNHTLKRIRILARPNRALFTLLIVVTAGESLYRYFLAEIFSKMVNEGSTFSAEQFVIHFILIISVLITGAICTYMISLFAEKSIQNSQKKIQLKLRESINTGLYAEVEKTEYGKYHTLMTSDTELVSSFYPKVIIPMIGGAVQFVFAVYFAFKNSWEIALIILGIAAFSFVVPKLFKQNLKEAKSEVQNNEGFIRNFFKHSLHRVDLVKVYESEQIEEKSLKDIHKKYGKSLIGQQSAFAKLLSTNNFLTYISIAAQSFIEIWFISMGKLTTGAFLGLSNLSSSINWPFWWMPVLINNLSQTEVAAERLADFIDSISFKPEMQDNTKTIYEENVMVAGENIYFSYTDKPILENFSFEIRKNEILGLTWKSGKGKSTLIKLILSLYTPQKGRIYKKSEDISFAYATQRETFFSDSIDRNVGLSEKVDGKILQNIFEKTSTDFLDKKISKSTLINKNGQPLSGGQQKRINLARAFYSDADILILDEPTASLDKETKSRVLEAIKKEKIYRTVVIITHDGDTSDICDRFLDYEYSRLA